MAKILQIPAFVPYFGPPPPWLSGKLPMFVLVADGIYEASDGTIVTVPAGYVTDFATVPRAVWSVVPPHGQLALAAIPHDWGFSHGGVNPFLTKQWWDELFRDLLVITPGISQWKIAVAYRAVQLGGKGGWVNGFHEFEPVDPVLALG